MAAKSTLPDQAVQSLEAALRGLMIRPADPTYDDARTVFNGMIDRRPALIVQAADEADVMAAVRFAAEHDLELAVRCGGHGVPGYGTTDGGLLLDLSAIRNVRVDPTARTARIGGGAQLGALDHATHAYGLATPAGFNSTTGVGGLTLGGGVGPYLSRRFGLTCDNLRSADVVTADGRRVTASATENEDLFWGIRGGGGNFGVVTSFEFGLHPVTDVVAGPIAFEPEAAGDVLAFYRDFLAKAPREFGGFYGFHLAPPLPFIPEDKHGTPVCLIAVCWSGDASKADAVLAPIRKAGPVIGEHVGQVPYPAIQSAFDPLLPKGFQHYWKADFVAEVTDDVIPLHVEHGLTVPSVNSGVHFYSVDAAVGDVAPEATAFAHRNAKFLLNIVGMWPDPADNAANTKWVRGYYDAVHPHSGFEAGYINFMDAEDQSRVRANYGANYDRLVEVKRRWDPNNLFRLNQNIAP